MFISVYILCDYEVNNKQKFIKIPFINEGMEFIDLHSIFKGKEFLAIRRAISLNETFVLFC